MKRMMNKKNWELVKQRVHLGIILRRHNTLYIYSTMEAFIRPWQHLFTAETLFLVYIIFYHASSHAVLPFRNERFWNIYHKSSWIILGKYHNFEPFCPKRSLKNWKNIDISKIEVMLRKFKSKICAFIITWINQTWKFHEKQPLLICFRKTIVQLK